ncbi:MAG: hypothetical protein KatS3mg105_1379 [Gemmatales bacterium]|nr:MAG: hypothetical protein KatS3mg105_1379 [Gemmatales bacterium]
MGLRDFLRRNQNQAEAAEKPEAAPLGVEELESRQLLDATATLAAGVLTVNGGANNDRINLVLDQAANQIVVQDSFQEVARFNSGAVTTIVLNGNAGNDILTIAKEIMQAATINGGAGKDVIISGGGNTTLNGDGGNDTLISGPGTNTLNGGAGADRIYDVKLTDTVVPDVNDQVFAAGNAAAPTPPVVLDPMEVQRLLERATAASASNDAIIVVMDRGGKLLGVRVESGVSPAVQGNLDTLIFAIDGAMAKARTAAFFANQGAPLTSRTVQFISQSTITQRQVESNPNITDPNSTVRGPGTVAPIGPGGHFPPTRRPPGVFATPMVDLFDIEHTNRDQSFSPGPDRIKGTADDIALPNRFNVPNAFIPSTIPPEQRLTPPDSYGFLTGLRPGFQGRGIGTLPGGVPLYKNGVLVGGIGVFFPGETGYANEENSILSIDHDPTKPDRSFEAEWIAFAAAGGSSQAGFPVGMINGVPALPGFDIPFGRLDLVGISLDVFGPGGIEGPSRLFAFGQSLGVGDPLAGTYLPIDGGGTLFGKGAPVPEGWLVLPHDSPTGEITAQDVVTIINQAIRQASFTRAAIRLPLSSRTRMVFSVSDRQGNILGLFRMPDATIFSIEVAVSKSRNDAYYADATALQPIDRVPGVPLGTAFTNRTFRFLADPRFPEGIDGTPPGPFSIFNDGGSDPKTGLNVGPPRPASQFQSVLGFHSFNPGTNFRDPDNIANQSGVVFFPGSAPLYRGNNLIGGLGVSGDGVDQDDVVAFIGHSGYAPPATVLRADQVFVRGIRLPFQKFLRNPEGG